jgi:hypothetical protein
MPLHNETFIQVQLEVFEAYGHMTEKGKIRNLKY